MAARRQRHATSRRKMFFTKCNSMPRPLASSTPHKTPTRRKHPEPRNSREPSSHARAANVRTPCDIKRTQKNRPSEYTAPLPYSWYLRSRCKSLWGLNHVNPLSALVCLQTRRKSLSLDDGGVGEGVGDAARKVRRQREKVIRQRETDYWNTLGGVIREETWQVNLPLVREC